MAQLDLEQSTCPVDRRRAEKEAERKALATREVEHNRQTENWARWIDQRIEQHLRRYLFSGDEEHPGALTEAIGRVMGENRMLARKELKAAIVDQEKWLATKLVELEERWKSAAAAFIRPRLRLRSRLLRDLASPVWRTRMTPKRPGGW